MFKRLRYTKTMPNMVHLQYEISDWEIQQSEGGASPNGKPNFWSQGNLPYPAFELVGTKENPEKNRWFSITFCYTCTKIKPKGFFK